MKVTLQVPEGLRDSVRSFVQAESLSIEVVSDGDGAVRVVQGSGRQQSDASTLQAGGWITCAAARAMTSKLRTDGRKVGKLLDLLDIKVRDCELGCFD